MGNEDIQAKKDFLEFLLHSFRPKKREVLWILNYLMNHEIVLKKTHFVSHASKTPRGIYINLKDGIETDFAFYKEGVTFKQPEQAFHDIRLNWHHNIYVEVIFDGSETTLEYVQVLEDNPFYPWNDHLPNETILRARNGLNDWIYTREKEELIKKIDQALSRGDEAEFIELTEKMLELNQTFVNYKQ